MAPKKDKKRPLSDYNIFVKDYFDDHTSATMEKAAAAWNKKKGSKAKSPKSTPKKKVRKIAPKKKKSRRNGLRLPGGLGVKGVAMGALGLLLVPQIIGTQSPGASKLATGLAMRAIKVGGGGALASVGLMELALQYLGGGLGGFSLGGGTGGTDF